MTASSLHCHILALEVVGPTHSSPRDLGLSLAILSELLVESEACAGPRSRGQLLTYPSKSGMFLLFLDDGAAPFLCALELWETLKTLPLMSVRMALHTGPVDAEAVRSPAGSAQGEGIDEVRSLLETARPGQILVSEDFTKSLKNTEVSVEQAVTFATANAAGDFIRNETQRVVILDPTGHGLGEVLESVLNDDGVETSMDRAEGTGVEWAKSVESRIRAADAVVAIVSNQTVSELLQHEIEIAVDERGKRGRPHVIPVWLNEGPRKNGMFAALSHNLHQAVWTGFEDTERVVDEVRTTLELGQAEVEVDRLDTTGSAISNSSKFYIHRPADRDFEQALNDRESIVLVKGPRQTGKTTLLGRGIEIVDNKGWRCAATDFQMLSSRQLESENSFYRVVVTTLSRQLGFDFDFDEEWLDDLSPMLNMDGFMRELLRDSDTPLVWIMDEADRLFTSPFATDFFGLIRSWHNARATDPRGPWDRLTIAIGYATEVHLFIRDLNKSPFNVGIPITLPMFTLEDTADLNKRYGQPIARFESVGALHSLVGGQPYLTRRAFDVLTDGAYTIESLLLNADRDDGPFGDHLKRILVSVTQLESVWDALVQSLSSPDLTDSDGLYRLIAANILIRKPNGKLELPCELYKRYLARYVNEERR